MRNLQVKYKNGEDAQNLVGSCAVLAIAAAKGMRYEDATEWTLKNLYACGTTTIAGRKHIKGVRLWNAMSSLKGLAKESVTIRYDKNDAAVNSYEDKAAELAFRCDLNNVDKIDGKVVKISTFAKNNPTGRHIIIARGHAIAVVHGVVVNNGNPNESYKNQIVQQSISFK